MQTRWYIGRSRPTPDERAAVPVANDVTSTLIGISYR
jgi:hypothetical protein